MQQNIGTVDRYLRLTSGILILTGGLQMRRSSLGKSALLAVGAMKIAEGVTGWCPLLSAFGIKTLEEGSNVQSSQQNQHKSQHEGQHEGQHNSQHASQHVEDIHKQQAHHEQHSSSNHAQTAGNHSESKSKHRTNNSAMQEEPERHVKAHEKQDKHASESRPSAEQHRSEEQHGNQTDQEILYS